MLFLPTATTDGYCQVNGRSSVETERSCRGARGNSVLRVRRRRLQQLSFLVRLGEELRQRERLRQADRYRQRRLCVVLGVPKREGRLARLHQRRGLQVLRPRRVLR